MKITFIAILLLALTIANCEYNEKQGLSFYNFCRLSYCPYDEITNLSKCGPTCEEFKTYMTDITLIEDVENHIFAYLFYHKIDKHLYVIYRGTQGNLNWMNNFDAAKVDYPECTGCKVHKGFYKYNSIITPKIKEPLLKLQQKYGTKKLNVAGHSLGGALATLGSVDLAKYNDLEMVITYGSPRVGNKEFALFWENNPAIKDGYRIVQCQDIVPHVPMIKLGFQHVGTEVWYPSNEKLDHQVCPVIDDPKCSDSVHFLKPYDHGKYFAINWMKDPYFGHCIGYEDDTTTYFNSIVKQMIDSQ